MYSRHQFAVDAMLVGAAAAIFFLFLMLWDHASHAR